MREPTTEHGASDQWLNKEQTSGKIIGNLTPEDDYTHSRSETNFNESVYFNFFDPAQQRGGFLRIGNRANEGYAEMTVIVWNPDGSPTLLMQNQR